MIQVENVSRVYTRGADRVTALNDVSMTIAKSRFVALMGPSGSGKSTLLNLIAGLDRPSSGQVKVNGELLAGLSDAELTRYRATKVGIIFQSFNLVPVLSALENVALPLLLCGLSRTQREQRAEAALKLVGMQARSAHRPAALSGGEQQRVAIARAIVTDPDILVADEPTGDLDADNAMAVLALLRELRESLGKTVLMVTHDARAEAYVDEVQRLDKGRYVQPEELRGAA